jgi:hypothetical protein
MLVRRVPNLLANSVARGRSGISGRRHPRLNLMTLEALAAAEGQGAELCLAAADKNPQLLHAAALRGTPARVVGD